MKATTLTSSQPIGIFDSGIGGLTIARHVIDNLPNEDIIYFGDTAHLPYGEKSQAAIQAYSIKIANFFLEKNCKLILIACNSASAAAYDLLTEYVGSKALIVNVVDPVINLLREKYQNQTIGLIGTKQTILSNIFQKRIDELSLNIKLISKATPLLVNIIEEGFVKSPLLQETLLTYLDENTFKACQAFILGCTHFPIIQKQIQIQLGNHVDIINSAAAIALAAQAILESQQLKRTQTTQGNHTFYVSDLTDSFKSHATLFFGEVIDLQSYRLWE